MLQGVLLPVRKCAEKKCFRSNWKLIKTTSANLDVFQLPQSKLVNINQTNTHFGTVLHVHAWDCIENNYAKVCVCVAEFSTLHCIGACVYKVQCSARVAVHVLGLHVHSGAVCWLPEACGRIAIQRITNGGNAVIMGHGAFHFSTSCVCVRARRREQILLYGCSSVQRTGRNCC